jgi:hypothetical protein
MIRMHQTLLEKLSPPRAITAGVAPKERGAGRARGGARLGAAGVGQGDTAILHCHWLSLAAFPRE